MNKIIGVVIPNPLITWALAICFCSAAMLGTRFSVGKMQLQTLLIEDLRCELGR